MTHNSCILLSLSVAALLSAGCAPRHDHSSKGLTASTELITSASATAVSVTGGEIAGYIDDGVYVYKGIPYAKADRFMPPQDPDAWEGIRSCRAYGPVSPQTARSGWWNDESGFSSAWNDGFPGEDCLRVNVWSSGIKDGAKRPVMVWLHGGGFSSGSGQEWPSYDGRSLARNHDVVVVTLNHRLNVLGFLDLSAFGEKYAASGNVGMMDIVKALEWVHDNIATFGGDPSNVTIFGQSGGGGKVSTLMAVPSAHGLFHKAIVESGSQLKVMEKKYSRRIGAATVRLLGINPSKIEELESVPYEDLLAAGEAAIAEVSAEAEKEGFNTFIFGWSPIVDGDFLPMHPFDGKAPEISRDIPMIIGTTQTEFCMSAYVPSFRDLSRAEAEEIIRQRYGDSADEFISIFDRTYPGHPAKDLFDYDMTFRPMAVTQASLKAAQGGAPVYTYIFRWESPVMDGVLRSSHCMEIPFVFDNAALHNTITGGGEAAIELGHALSSAWVSFARTGDPNGRGDMPQWKPFEPGHGYVMVIDEKCTLEEDPDKELMDFVSRRPMGVI